MNRRILITRSIKQSSALAEQLTALGFEPILIPAIEIADPTTLAPLDTAIAHLDTFHWLLFTSANAVEVFASRLRLSTPYSLLPTPCRVAAIGPATARAAEAIGLHIDLLPPQAIAESLTEALLPHALQPGGAPTRFLLIRAEQARDHLPGTLRSAGAEVTIAPAYRTIIPTSSIEAVRKLFSPTGPEVHAITFTSSSTATNLVALLEASNLTLPPEIPRISIGPVTSQTLRDLNLPPHAESPQPTIPALVTTVIEMLNTRSAPDPMR